MGKSENGPDMLDCLEYLREIELGTGTTIIVLLSVAPRHATFAWFWTLLATQDGPVALAENRGVAVNAWWPHRDHKTFTGALFASLALLDGEIGKARFCEVVNIS